MSGVLTQTTAPESQRGMNGGTAEVPVIRWVAPLPYPPPLWCQVNSVVIGRDADCGFQLESARVSRRHAQLTRSDPLWILTDLDSKNGVFLNGQRVKAAAVSPGDVIRIGDFVGVCRLAPPTADLSFADFGDNILGGFEHRELVRRLDSLATSALPVVVQGMTGTGKERFANALHERSGRSGRFFAVNCAVYSKAVAAAELFGYRKGAFTGAEQPSTGHIRSAQEGTLLLDELVDLPLDVQSMLLRVIENREVLALGESKPTPINVRFVAATQVPLAQAVEEGRFRADLRARLEGAVLRLPTLAECRDIVPELFCALVERYAGTAPTLSASSVERLCLHDWPLNIRELEMLARRIAAGKLDRVEVELSLLGEPQVAKPPVVPVSEQGSERRSKLPLPGRRAVQDGYYEESEMRALLDALAVSGGNVTKAARLLGLSRPKVYRLLDAATRAGLVN